MDVSVSKWGNSLAVRIPSAFVKDLSLRDGDRFEVLESDGAIVLKKRKATLFALLSRVTPENLHAQEDWGASVGLEKLPEYE